MKKLYSSFFCWFVLGLMALTLTHCGVFEDGSQHYPLIQINNAETVIEGNTAQVTFTLSIIGKSSWETAQIVWSTSDNTALAEEDYTAQSGTLTLEVTFPNSDTIRTATETITVPLLEDSLPETAESFHVIINCPSNFLEIYNCTTNPSAFFTYEIVNEDLFTNLDDSNEGWRGIATAMITDTNAPTVSFDSSSIEIEEGQSLTLTIGVTSDLSNGAQVAYSLDESTATLDTDYTLDPTTNPLSFNTETNEQTITLTTTSDNVTEGNEQIVLTINDTQKVITVLDTSLDQEQEDDDDENNDNNNEGEGETSPPTAKVTDVGLADGTPFYVTINENTEGQTPSYYTEYVTDATALAIVLDASETTGDGTLTYQWVITNADDTVVYQTETTETTTTTTAGLFGFSNNVGDYTITLTVTDGDNETDTDSTTFGVYYNF